MSEHLQAHEITGFDGLSDERRDAALEHLGACATCRAGWLAEDGSRVFSLLSLAPIPEDRLEQLSRRVDAALEETAPRVAAIGGIFRVASIAASLLLAVVLGAALWTHELPSAALAAADSLAGSEEPEEEIAGIRLVGTPGGEARVLDLSIGGTQILMIFDESIQL